MSVQRPTLLLVDGLNVIRRVYEANPAPDSLQKAQGALHGAHSSLLRALSDHRPTHCALVLDPVGPTWRHKRYSHYKSNRNPMPEALAKEIDRYVAAPERAINAVYRYPGHEADDVMGSLAVIGRRLGMEVIVLSTDKDMLTLLPMGVRVYHHFEYRWLDEAWCQKKFGVGSSLLADFLALMGDAVDCVPGVDKIGCKTAAKLLLEYGGLDAILENAAHIKGVAGKNLLAQASQARLSRELVQLRLNVFGQDHDLAPLSLTRQDELVSLVA